MKYIVSLIFSIYFSAKHFGKDSVPNYAALAYYLQHTPVDTIGYILGGMLPTILIWVGIAWLIKKLKPQQSMPSVQTPTKQAPQSALSAYTQNTNTQHLATTQEATPFTHSATPSLTMAMSNSQEHSDDDLWEQALNEYDSSARKQGLWARLFSEARGNEAITKANYLRMRVEEIKHAEDIKVERIKLEHATALAKQASFNEETNSLLLDALAGNKLTDEETDTLNSAKSPSRIHKMTPKQLEYSKRPKCTCPYCKNAILTFDAKSCPKCQTVFTTSSVLLRLSPINQQLQTEILRLAVMAEKSLAEFETDLLKNLTKN